VSDRRESSVWLDAVPKNETRAAGKDEHVLQVRGYAIVWNSPSERMGSVIETIDPRSLDGLGDLNKSNVRMQVEHCGLAIARCENGSLRLTKDKRGLFIEADLDSRRSDARDLYYAVERGDVNKMSFGFRIAPGGEELDEQEDGTLRAHVTKISRLYEVSGVTFPAYTDTDLEAVPSEVEVEDDEDRSWEIDLLRARTSRGD